MPAGSRRVMKRSPAGSIRNSPNREGPSTPAPYRSHVSGGGRLPSWAAVGLARAASARSAFQAACRGSPVSPSSRTRADNGWSGFRNVASRFSTLSSAARACFSASGLAGSPSFGVVASASFALAASTFVSASAAARPSAAGSESTDSDQASASAGRMAALIWVSSARCFFLAPGASAWISAGRQLASTPKSA